MTGWSARTFVLIIATAALFAVPLPVDDGESSPAGGLVESLGIGTKAAAAHNDDNGLLLSSSDQSHISLDNACTGVRDRLTLVYTVRVLFWETTVRLFLFDFTHACSHHDSCYIHKQGVTSDSNGRLRCDSLFKQDMHEMCNHHSDLPWMCRRVADLYYLGVRAFGEYSWENSSPCTSWRSVLTDEVALAGVGLSPFAWVVAYLIAGDSNIDECEEPD